MKSLKKINKFIKKNQKLLRKIVLVIFFTSIGAVYFHNVTRDVYSGDIGDLVTAAWVFGVPHPPGYPLFTLLGYLFSHLIPGTLPPVTKVGFISAISSLIGLIFIYKFAFRVTKSLYLSLLSVSILAFSYFYWLQAEIPEVFGLNNLFIILILYYAILFYQEKKSKYLFLLVFLCGLSLTHHHTILFIFPSVLLLIIRHFKFVFLNPKRLLIMTGLFILGLIPYVYVPIAASHNPVINWENASNAANFMKLISRSSYGGFAPDIVKSSINFEYLRTLRLLIVQNYLSSIISNFSYQIVFIFIIGLIYLFLKSKYLLISLVVGLFLTGPFFIFYAAPVALQEALIGMIERFYVFSSIIFMLIVIYGFFGLKIIIDKYLPKKIYSQTILLYFLIIPAFMFNYNNPKIDLSKSNIGNNLARDFLTSLPKNSVIFVSGDNVTFNIWYMRYVLGFRRDVEIIDSTGSGNNQYFEKEVNKYIKNNPKQKGKNIIIGTIEDIKKKRRIFNPPSEYYDNNRLILIPIGLSSELIYIKDLPPKENYNNEIKYIFKSMKIPERNSLEPFNNNLLTMEIPMIYSEALIQTGRFFNFVYNDPDKAEYYFKEALRIDPEFHHVYVNLGLNHYTKYRDCKYAIDNTNKAIELYPVRKDYFFVLNMLYNKCNLSKDKREKLKKEYKNRFNKNIDEEFKKFYSL